jgi:hypothetical protein
MKFGIGDVKHCCQSWLVHVGPLNFIFISELKPIFLNCPIDVDLGYFYLFTLNKLSMWGVPTRSATNYIFGIVLCDIGRCDYPLNFVLSE